MNSSWFFVVPLAQKLAGQTEATGFSWPVEEVFIQLAASIEIQKRLKQTKRGTWRYRALKKNYKRHYREYLRLKKLKT